MSRRINNYIIIEWRIFQMVKLYTKNNCMQCKFVKMFLDNKNVDYQEINVDEDEKSLEFLKEEGFMSMPVVMDDNGFSMSGNNMAKLQTLVG